MKKTVLSLAVVALSLFGASAYAQTPSNTTTTQCTTQSCVNTKARGGAQKVSPFDKLNLTDQQKASIEAINQQYKGNKGQKANAQGQNATTTDKVAKDQRRANGQNSRQEYLAKIKEVLTPDQYVEFLETVYVISPNRPNGIAKAKANGNNKLQQRNGIAKKDGKRGSQRNGAVKQTAAAVASNLQTSNQ